MDDHSVQINYCTYLHSHQHAGIFVPCQQRVFPIPRLRIFDISPAVHKVLVTHDLSQFTSDCTIHILNDVKVSGEEDIKVTLMNL